MTSGPPVGSENLIWPEITGLSTTQLERALMGDWLHIGVWGVVSSLTSRRDLALENIAPSSAKTSSAWSGLMFRPSPLDRKIVISWLPLVLRVLTGMVRSRASLAAENASRCQKAMLAVSP